MRYYLPLLLAIAAPLAVQAEYAQGGSPSQMFLQQFDANKDGKVTFDEFRKPQLEQFQQGIQQQFQYMDKNNDGKVDGAEADAFAEEMQERMEQAQKQEGGYGQAPKY